MQNPIFIGRSSLGGLCLALSFSIVGVCTAQKIPPPDFTAPGVIAGIDRSSTFNLGPTGLRGWIYCNTWGFDDGGTGRLTDESRQILVTTASTPATNPDANGNSLAVNDVILGAIAASSGTVPSFTSDARKALGTAITNAEKTGAGTLRVKRWRAGTTTDVNITITTLGEYSATAPYSCPKSAQILANARNQMVGELIANPNYLDFGHSGAIHALALLASVQPGDPNYSTVQTRLQTYARAYSSKLPKFDSGNWGPSYQLVFLAEYYLLTNDAQVVPTINAFTLWLTESLSMWGTCGHEPGVLYQDGSGRRISNGYGPVNAVSNIANLAIVLSKKALQAAIVNGHFSQPIDPKIDTAIFRISGFLGSYVNKGGIPYGEHRPITDSHASNGKDASAAVIFGLQADKAVQAEFFSRMAIASWVGVDVGHTGQELGMLWAALGAGMGGEAAASGHFKQLLWRYDIQRRTNGSFTYDNYGNDHYSGGTTSDGTYLGGSAGNGVNGTAIYLLTYSLPLKRLYITGKQANPAYTLDSTKVANSVSAGVFQIDRTGLSIPQLFTAFGEYDPVVRYYASVELAARSLTSADLTTLRSLLTNADPNIRKSAAEALGIRKDTTALPTLVGMLNDPDHWVRQKAAAAIYKYPASAVSPHRDALINSFIANAPADPDVPDWTDPMQFSLSALSEVLFDQLADYTINADKTTKLYPALRAGLVLPTGAFRGTVAVFARNRLNLTDLQAVYPELAEVASFDTPADRMFSPNCRINAMAFMAENKIIEGIPIALFTIQTAGQFSNEYIAEALNALASYGDAARYTLPSLRELRDEWQVSWWYATPDGAPYLALIKNTITVIENAISAPATNLGKCVANSQIVTTTGAKAITLTGVSPRGAFSFLKLTDPANGTLTGTAPNFTYTPNVGFTGTDKFTFQTQDSLTTSDPSTVSIIVGSSGTGIVGAYFNNADFTSPVLTRTDAQINFDWGTGSPAPAIGTDTFSTRWSGYLLAPETGTYTLSGLTSDGFRAYLNGVPVINNLNDQSTRWTDGQSITLTAGQKVPLFLEYYENTGSAVAKLKWTGPSYAGLNGTIIPQAYLFENNSSGGPDTTAPVITARFPADNATYVAHATDLVATFSENIVRGTGNITLKNLSDGTQTLIPVTDTAQIAISGATLIINPTALLVGGKNYAVQIDATAIVDTAGLSFAGITNDTLWNFATVTVVWNVNIGTEITPSDNFFGAASENTVNSTWNSFVEADLPAPKALVDSTGASTLVTMAVTAATLPTIYNAPQPGDEIFTSWMKAASNSVDFTITFAGLPPGDVYDLVVYADWYWDPNAITITQSSGTGLASPFVLNFGKTTGHVNADTGPLSEDTNPANVGSGTLNWNYTRLKTLTPNASGNLAFLIDGGNWPISGFQLVKMGGGPPDSTPPTISTYNPTDEATGVAVTSNLVATFSENIAIGTGNITIKNLSDATQTVITLPNAQVTAAGAVLTINPTTNLLGGKNYAIQIAATALKDFSNNAFAGIANNTTWNFATPDTTPPTISTYNPADNAASVAVAANLVATFSEAIAIGTGNITIKNLTDATQTVITLPNAQVTAAGAVLTINPTADLLNGKNYAIQIAATAVKDLANNAFAGIANDTTWNFATTTGGAFRAWNVDFGDPGSLYTGIGVAPDTGTTWNNISNSATNAPLVDSTGGASGVSLTLGDNIFTYGGGTTNDLLLDYLFIAGNGTSTTTLSGLTANSAFSLYLYGNGDQTDQCTTFTLNAANGGATGRSFGSDRSDINATYVKLDGIVDGSGNINFTWTAAPSSTEYGVLNGLQLLVSGAPDTTPPVISSFNPADNATGVAVTANIVATFSENIAIGTGNITIKNLSDSSQTVITLPNAQVTAAGAVLTINPTSNLLGGKNYAIQIAATAVKDLSNNAFAGIANDTTWNFTTANVTAGTSAVWNVNIGDQVTTADNYAGAVPQTSPINWNSITTSSYTGLALKDSTGSTTGGITLDLTSERNPDSEALTSGDKIFIGFFGTAGAASTMTLRGLTVAKTYDIVFYSDFYWKNGDSLPITQTAGTGLSGTFYINRIFSGLDGTVPALTPDNNPADVTSGVGNIGNYCRIVGIVPDLDGKVSFRIGDGANTAFSGFQLVQTGVIAPRADMRSLSLASNPPSIRDAVISGTNVTLSVPYGSNVSALAPTFTLWPGATSVPVSGTTRNFTTPQTYTVTSSDSLVTKTYTVTVVIAPPLPEFTLTAPANWDGRQTITVQPNITNLTLLQANGGTNFTYQWSVSGVAVTKQITPGVLSLTRSQGNGPLVVTLTMANGTETVTRSTTIQIQEPTTADPWVERSPAANEKPVNGQFFARNPYTNLGTIFYRGTQSGTPDTVFLKVYKTPSGGSETLDATYRQALAGGTYAFTAPVAAGLFTYRVVYGTTTGVTDTVVATVTGLVCGDAYMINGQSNAEATSSEEPQVDTAYPWIYTYNAALGWGPAIARPTSPKWESRIGFWGMKLAQDIVAQHQMPVCIINGAAGGTRIDQHQANPANPTVGAGTYDLYAGLLNRVLAARLAHGIRGIFWHQGENNSGNAGPMLEDDYLSYQQLFLEMSSAWKRDYPNFQRYLIFQVMPKPCGMGPYGDQLREAQRTLPFFYSNMSILNTLGIVGADGCHFSKAGYESIADRVLPVVKRDFYGIVPSGPITAPNLKRAYFTSAARTAIALEFDQDMSWSSFSMANYYLDDAGGKVTSGSAAGNIVTLQLTSAAAANATLDYLKDDFWSLGESISSLLYGANGIPALTFADVPILATPAAVPPTVSTYSPADNAAAVPATSNLVATFSEAIAIGTGNITIKNLSDATQTVITLPNAQVTVSGSVLTINPTADLLGGKNYAIQIAATAVKDLTNIAYAGIANDTTWNFATAETIPPTISTYSPADNATGVAVTANLVATFSEAIAIGTGNITIKNLTDSTQTVITLPSAQVTISGAVLTINPTTDLLNSKNYAVQIAATAVKDLSNNAFAGIANDTTWNFATPDTIPPTVSTYSPADNATGVAITANLVATFSEAIAIGTGNITIKNLSDSTQTVITLPNAQVTISGAVLTINPTANLLNGKNYAVQIAATAVKDLANNAFAGITNDTTWNFATPDIIPPTVSTFSPADNAAAVAVTENLVATFSEAIAIGTGNITIKNLTDATQTTIDVTDTTQVSISGAVLTINPSANLLGAKNYAIQIAATAVKDLANNAFAGIANDTTWNFTSAVIPFVWTQATGGAQAWTTGANWQGGNFPSSVDGDTLDFSTVNIAADTTLTLGADRTAGNWKFGDTSGAQNWIVSAGNQMILAGTTPTIEVNQNTATLNNVVAGSNGLLKTGAGTLDLYGVNTYTGGTTINAGTIKINNADSFGGTGIITFAGNGTIQTTNASYPTLANGIQVNPSTTATLQVENQYYKMTYTGPVTGSGTLVQQNGGSGGTGTVTLSNIANTFTGILQLAAPNGKTSSLTVNSLADSANSIRFTTSSGTAATGNNFTLGAGTATPLLFNNRQIELASTTGTAGIYNANALASNTITINTNLLITANGAKTLLLGGANSGANTFAGTIGDSGSGATSITKADAGRWILSGTNSYTGATTLTGGTLSVGASNNLGAAANSLVFNGGTLRITGTALTNFSGIGHAVSFTAAKAVGLDIDDASHTFTADQILNQTTGALTKAGAGTLVLDKVNTYTGATTISGGTLQVNSPGSLASASAVAVNGTSTLGGNGTISGSVTVAATASLAPGASVGTLTIGGGLNISALANNGAGKLRFELGPIAASDKITVGGALTIGTAYLGFSDFDFSSLAGLQNGTYTLISYNTLSGTLAASGLSGAIGTGTGTLQIGGNSLQLVVSGVTTSPWATWAVGGVAFDADTNNDGVDNGMAWLLGATNSSENAVGKLPASTSNGTHLRLTFRCLKSTQRGGAVLKLQCSNDLGQTDPWTAHEAAVPDADGTVNGVVFDTTDDGNYINVIADIPATGSKLFVRLSAVVSP